MADYKLICGDALEVLKKGKEKSIQCAICSPPYFGLRNYQTASWEGGDSECDHIEKRNLKRDHSGPVFKGTRSQQSYADSSSLPYKNICRKCGATRIDQQIGLENRVEDYVDRLVEVFREVRRMLRDDGVFFLNLGDSYNGSGGAGGDYNKGGLKEGQPRYPGRNLAGLGPKQLLGVPWRVAFALQADGWILRQDLIWAKPNPMPESVKDRCTKSHEYIFLFAKSPKYFFDGEAIKEPSVSYEASKKRYESAFGGKKNQELLDTDQVHTRPIGMKEFDGKRNKRSVWTITTKSYKEAHFAVFPPDLVEPMVLAGTPEYGSCRACGKPYQRVVEKQISFEGGSGKAGRTSEDANATGKWAGQQYGENIKLGPVSHTQTVGWKADCSCNSEPVKSWILDPFAGSCTTGVVALENNRRFIGIDLNPNYIAIGEKRIQKEIYGRN